VSRKAICRGIRDFSDSLSTYFVNKGKKKGRDYSKPRPGKELTLCRPALLFGNEPELLHRAQIIVALPLLNYLAVLDAVHGEPFDLYLPASGRAK
jgi:hypothetical protein